MLPNQVQVGNGRFEHDNSGSLGNLFIACFMYIWFNANFHFSLTKHQAYLMTDKDNAMLMLLDGTF